MSSSVPSPSPSPVSGMTRVQQRFLQQARMLDKVDPFMAYYTRLYALQLGMKYPEKTKEDRQLLNEQLALVERFKSQHSDEIGSMGKEDARNKCEAFALQVFSHGDDEDRAGRANKKTALSFHAAYVLMDVCRQFSPNGELPSDMAEKQKYAIVKAADINKALKEGRVPKPGPLVESQPDELSELMGGPGEGGGGGGSSSVSAASHSAGSSSGGYVPSSVASSSSANSMNRLPTSATINSGSSGRGGYTPSSYQPSSAAAAPFVGASSIPAASLSSYAANQSHSASSSPWPSSAASSVPAAAVAHDGYAANAASYPTAPSMPSMSASAPAYQPAVAPSAPVSSHSGWSSASAPPPAASAPPASSSHSTGYAGGGGGGGYSGGGGGSSSSASRMATDPKVDAVRSAERLIKHALGSVAFADVDTTIVKLQQALALLQPYASRTH